MSRHLKMFDEETIIKVLVAFLVDEFSHRQIQREILGLPAPARGGGYVAMEILHYYGINGDKKGLLKNRDGNDELNNADGLYKDAIKKVLEYIKITSDVEKNIELENFSFTSNTTEFTTQTKVRINQTVLRKLVLNNYNNQCALCSINKSDLLICSHIKLLAIDIDNRLNPKNAICLCVLHDGLFDKGYISLDKDYNVLFSQKSDEMIRAVTAGITFKKPNRYLPDEELLEYHFREICK